ncbi:MAG: hypothetical protein HQK75_09650 [Candidatus Magnetomorum sp.]|nr:hypothetical protein [Candidatus Magnetomorum sp.]
MDVNRKIRIDGDYLQSYQDDYFELQIDKMNQRVTFFSIIFIILMGVALTFCFFYIRNNVQRVPQEVQDLSHQLVESMSTLSERHTQMESTLKSKLSLLEKMTEALRKDQKENQDAMDRLSRTKADQNDIGPILEKSNQENYKAIEEVRKHLNTMNATFTKQFNTFSEQFQSFNQDVNDIVQTSIASIQKDVQDRLSRLSTSIQSVESDMKTLKTRVTDMSSSLNTVKSSVNDVVTNQKDMIDSEKLEEFLSIEREELKNNAARQKALMDNHLKVLEERLENIRLKVNNIQSLKKNTSPTTEAEPLVLQELPIKTKKKNLLPKTSYLEPEEPDKIEVYTPPKPPPTPVFQPVGKKPPIGKMIEEDLRE